MGDRLSYLILTVERFRLLRVRSQQWSPVLIAQWTTLGSDFKWCFLPPEANRNYRLCSVQVEYLPSGCFN